MKEHTIPFSEIQQEIPHLPDRFTEPLEAAIVTCGKQNVMAILPYPAYKALLGYIDSLEEILEIMSDLELMAAIREGIQDIEQGRTVAWEDVKKELDKMDALQETLEIMSDPETMVAFREGVQAMERGEIVALEDVEKELDRQNEREEEAGT